MGYRVKSHPVWKSYLEKFMNASEEEPILLEFATEKEMQKTYFQLASERKINYKEVGGTLLTEIILKKKCEGDKSYIEGFGRTLKLKTIFRNSTFLEKDETVLKMIEDGLDKKEIEGLIKRCMTPAEEELL